METNQPGSYNAASSGQWHPGAERRKAHAYPITFILDGSGRIIVCGSCGEKLFGFGHGELQNRHICHVFPQLLEPEFIKHGQVNPRFVFLSHSGFLFKARNQQQRVFGCTLNFTEFVTLGLIRTVSLVAYPSRCRRSENFGAVLMQY